MQLVEGSVLSLLWGAQATAMWTGTCRPCCVVSTHPPPGSLEDHIVGVVGVAHGIGPPQQHLERDVGDELPELLQTPPRALVQEAHRNIKRGSCTGTERPGSAPNARGTPWRPAARWPEALALMPGPAYLQGPPHSHAAPHRLFPLLIWAAQLTVLSVAALTAPTPFYVL